MSPEVVALARRIAASLVRANPLLVDDFDDLVQEGLLATWRGRQMRTAMIDWLRATYGRLGYQRQTVARWASLDAFTMDDGPTWEPTAPDNPATTACDVADAVRALRDLPERQRVALVLTTAGWTLREVAESWGVSEALVCKVRAKPAPVGTDTWWAQTVQRMTA